MKAENLKIFDEILDELKYEKFHIHYHSNPRLIEPLIEAERKRQLDYLMVLKERFINTPKEQDEWVLVSQISDEEVIPTEPAIETKL